MLLHSMRQATSRQTLCSSSNGTVANFLHLREVWYLSSAAESGFEDVIREQAECLANVAGAGVGVAQGRDELCVGALCVDHGVDGTWNAWSIEVLVTANEVVSYHEGRWSCDQV